MIAIRRANIDDMPIVNELFREYASRLGVDLSFQDFEKEMASLPGKYSPPRGSILLAFNGESPAGCVTMRAISADIAEMKRLYVRPAFRERGAGRLLVSAIIEESRAAGYTSMRLDTLSSMEQAQALYRIFGFKEMPPYYRNPLEGAVYMELDLK